MKCNETLLKLYYVYIYLADYLAIDIHSQSYYINNKQIELFVYILS
jgi:hypothetical protein